MNVSMADMELIGKALAHYERAIGEQTADGGEHTAVVAVMLRVRAYVADLGHTTRVDVRVTADAPQEAGAAETADARERRPDVLHALAHDLVAPRAALARILHTYLQWPQNGDRPLRRVAEAFTLLQKAGYEIRRLSPVTRSPDVARGGDVAGRAS